MLEKIKQEIVVIIISISSMLITAFATIYGVNITNEYNLKIQDRNFKVENARKEIQKREEILKKITELYSNSKEYAVPIKEFRQFGNELIFVTRDKKINDTFKKFMNDCFNLDKEEQNQDKLNKTYLDLISLIIDEKIKYQLIISNPTF